MTDLTQYRMTADSAAGLVRSIEEVNEIAESSRKLSVDFVFIQSKMRPSFEIAELNNFGTGVRLFEVDPIGWTKNRPFLDGAAG